MNIQVSSISSTITRIQQKSSSSRKPPFCSSRKSQEPNQNGDTNECLLPRVQPATLSISCQNPVFFLDKQQATSTVGHASISCSLSLLRGLEIMGIRSNELEKI
ncbi:hypothetical protein OIU79_028423 [Salix purpurea]|uniref:Uncharacterized protein n=1 Tax=Salix purpurea TaxID=77065 RepID=A0A9Q0VX61_SALPP|nr:hypothetical protein OIU79_028423 [Salix purpurea]